MKYIDLTHTIRRSMPVYPGDQNPEINQVDFLAKNGYNDTIIKIGTHVGTHMEAPSHMLKNGKRLSDYPSDYFFGNGRLIKAKDNKIGADLLKNTKIAKGDIVLVMTGFYKKFGQAEYYETYPEISEPFAKKIIELGVKIIGLDTPSPDRLPFSIHKLLLANNVLIIENLTNLAPLTGHKFTVAALPVKIATEAAPVRVIAHIK